MMVAAGAAQAAMLEVTVAGVRSDRGTVRVAVCSRETFLKPTCEHVADAPARVGSVVVRVGVPPGVWAAQAFHDENGNERIDTNLLGIPTEGLGFSNDVRFRFGPPGFDEAAFQLGPAGGAIGFTLRYF